MSKPETIVVDEVKYVRADKAAQTAIPGKRAVVVVDRGWIFAGDVTRENDRVRLTNAIWVCRWESIGFDGMIANPKDKKVFIKPVPGGVVDVPKAAELFCIPVPDGWGL